MSSASTNTWFGKIALAEHVVRRLIPEAMNAADRVHADWQRRASRIFPLKNPTP